MIELCLKSEICRLKSRLGLDLERMRLGLGRGRSSYAEEREHYRHRESARDIAAEWSDRETGDTGGRSHAGLHSRLDH